MLISREHSFYQFLYQVADKACYIHFFISEPPPSGGYLKGLQNKIDGMVTRINAIETGDSTSNVIYYFGYLL